MNWIDIVLLLLIAAAVIRAVIVWRRSRKNGGCGCGCAGCTGGTCARSSETQSEKEKS
ncbi:MAG TPA: FeoB-associated Cys-rich membrane protein [Ruminococcus sp.]|nr:FeoB-associated Cys-rich membrane protein [Ruminococcus sp.]